MGDISGAYQGYIKGISGNIPSPLMFQRSPANGSGTLNELLFDVCLDTFPYNGVTTTFESLWMGVPVITLKGDRFVSRCGYSINENAGLKNFIAENKNEYLSIALQYMSQTNIKKLIDLRKKLRTQLLKSSLFDINSFAENFITELNKVYEKNKTNS